MKRNDLRVLPDTVEAGDWLYAFETDAGTVKVGATRSPRWRMEGMFDFVRRKRGERMIGAFLVRIPDRDLFARERQMLAMCWGICKPEQGREWFRDLSFADAIKCVRAAAEQSTATQGA